MDKNLISSIMKLSDHFVKNSETIGSNRLSPFSNEDLRNAYKVYFGPLNRARADYVITQAKHLEFFNSIQNITELGAGFGSLSHSLVDYIKDSHASTHLKKIRFLDISQECLDSLKLDFLNPKQNYNKHIDFEFQKIDLNKNSIQNTKEEQANSLVCMSFFLNELDSTNDILKSLLTFENILILDSSTKAHSRNLMSLREHLIQNNYFIWAPCTHQSACPLLHQSENDWCHMRILREDHENASQNSYTFKMTPEFYEIEKHLPIKNKSLTFSYLLASRKAPEHTKFKCKVLQNPTKLEKAPETVRVIGDRLDEKGKTKQAICRNTEREFLAWFPQRKNQENIFFERGELLQIISELDKKSNEIRITSDQILEN